mmetsp:Transcript_12956/g.18921  ORF Transcript_12956/g.18921 Transcript_12956/m.18921 type:complete len:95 (-) Transcript_12956:132-416(-)
MKLHVAADSKKKLHLSLSFSSDVSECRSHVHRNNISIQESSISIQNSIASSMERITEKFEEKDPKNKNFDKLNNLTKKTLLAFATTNHSTQHSN